MIKKWLFMLLLISPLTAHAANKYMVENTTGTNSCYYFGTVPTCSTTIVGLSTTSFNNLLNSTNTWTAPNTFTSTVTLVGALRDSTSSSGVSGQILQTSGTGAVWTTNTAGNLASTQTWTGGNTFNSTSGITVTTITFVSNTAGGIKGTTTNNSVNPGFVGEYISSVAGPVTINAGTGFINVATINLTAGDWDVSGVWSFAANGGTITMLSCALSSFTGNTTTDQVKGDNQIDGSLPLAGVRDGSCAIPAWRLSIAAGGTYYIKAASAATVASPTAVARISARRVR